MILDGIVEFYDDIIIKADGFDEAVIGIDKKSMRLIYSVKKCLDILMVEMQDMETAIEYFEYNIINSYIGDKTPIWCWDCF